MVPASHPTHPLQRKCGQRWSAASHRLSTTVRDHTLQKASFVWSHSPCWASDGLLLSSSCRHLYPSTGLGKANMTFGSHLDPLRYHWGWSEALQLWPLLCRASSSRPKRVEPTCADSYNPIWGPLLMMMVTNVESHPTISMNKPLMQSTIIQHILPMTIIEQRTNSKQTVQGAIDRQFKWCCTLRCSGTN